MPRAATTSGTSITRARTRAHRREPPMKPFGLQSMLVATCLIATGGASLAAAPHQPGSRGIDRRGDVRNLPGPLKDRLVELANRSHTYPPLTVFSEAASPSQLFGYFLLDTTGFEKNVFTATIPGINDGVAPTATGANHDTPTLGAVRLVLEPKPGLPTDPNDPGAFIDIFTDISPLFVINNESAWYEGWMIHDVVVPDVGPLRADGTPQFGMVTQDDAQALV